MSGKKNCILVSNHQKLLKRKEGNKREEESERYLLEATWIEGTFVNLVNGSTTTRYYVQLIMWLRDLWDLSVVVQVFKKDFSQAHISGAFCSLFLIFFRCMQSKVKFHSFDFYNFFFVCVNQDQFWFAM